MSCSCSKCMITTLLARHVLGSFVKNYKELSNFLTILIINLFNYDGLINVTIRSIWEGA